MWAAQIPSMKASDIAIECASTVRDQELKERVLKELPQLEVNSEQYRMHGEEGSLWATSHADYPVHTVTAEEFVWLYEQRLVGITSPARHFYDELLASAQLQRCPYCNQNTPTTLDHFLPKAVYATLAIDPWNLVPCCTACNGQMMAHVAATAAEAMFHPYFESVDDGWLTADIVRSETIAAIFYVQAPTHWPDLLVKRVRSTFEMLKLGRAYSAFSAGAIAELIPMVHRVYGEGRHEAVRRYLLDESASIADVVANSWRSVLLKGLADSEWFCKGGFLDTADGLRGASSSVRSSHRVDDSRRTRSQPAGDSGGHPMLTQG